MLRSCLLFLFCWISLLSLASGPVNKISFNERWKFKRLDSSQNSQQFFHASVNDADWERVQLPHTARLEPMVVNDQWQGICWYRKSFEVPASYKGKRVWLELEGAMNEAHIWINGQMVTTQQGGYLPVMVDATPLLIPGKKNIIAIRLDNRDNPVTGPKPLKILDFNMYGGLYRNAWLVVKEPLHITHPIMTGKVAGGGVFITFPKVAKDASVVKVQTHVQNSERKAKTIVLEHSLFYNGKLVQQQLSETVTLAAGKDATITTEMNVQQPQLWSPDAPNLYVLETVVKVDGKVVDKEQHRFGIRQFEFRGQDLYINGEKTFLRGVNRHQEYPFIGYALSDNAQYRDAKKIKEGGFNYIRLSHYPQAPAFMDACDELGLVVLDAILGWQYYADTDAFRNFCYQSATDLVRRDRNHPCVLAWEVSLNETKMPVFFMEQLHNIVHAEYPGSNVYTCGWMPDVYDIYLQARQHRLLHPGPIGSKPYAVSEYGDWEYYSTNAGLNQHKMPKNERIEKSSRQLRSYGEARLLQQVANIQEAHNDNLGTPAFGDSYWVMYDYNRGYHDDLEASGLMDIFRLPKFSYYFFKSQQHPLKEVVLQIGSYWTADSPTDVKVFSNCEKVQLFVNDRLIGEQLPDSDKYSSNLSHPPFTFSLKKFEPGTLKAVGFINGKKVAEQQVHTPGRAASLKVWLDESGKAPEAGCSDVLFVYVAAVDEKGTIVPHFSEKVELEIEGATLMNVREVKAEAGIATALIQIGNKGGTLKIKARAGNLSSTDFVMPVSVPVVKKE